MAPCGRPRRKRDENKKRGTDWRQAAFESSVKKIAVWTSYLCGTRIGEAGNPGPPMSREDIGQWLAQQILKGQSTVSADDCKQPVILHCGVSGGCKKHRAQCAKNAAGRTHSTKTGCAAAAIWPDFGDKEKIPAVERLRMVLQNVQSLTTVGTSALQDEAVVHVWP